MTCEIVLLNENNKKDVLEITTLYASQGIQSLNERESNHGHSEPERYHLNKNIF